MKERKILIKETKANTIILYIARWFAGLVFLFSSFTKGVDPLGTAYKIEEYMTAWSFGGISFEGFLPLAPVLSMALVTMEFLIGVMLITGAFRKLTAWLLLLMMTFFTATTLYDALSNKVTDCGCFGDFLKLSNWQTFWKNVVLDVPTIYIFLTRRWPRRRMLERDMLIAIAAIAAMVIFGIYNINNEPVLDFRSWKVGNHMVDNLEEGLPEVNIATYTNTKSGKQTTFDMKDWKDYQYILSDTTGEWQLDTIVTKAPYDVHADGFFIKDGSGLLQDENGKDLTFKLIAATEKPVLICTIHHLDDVNQRGVEAIAAMKQLAIDKNLQFAILAYCEVGPEAEDVDAEAEAILQRFLYSNQLMDVDHYHGDEKAIETMLRSNPGFILMHNGVVKGKWHYRNIDKLKKYPFEEINN